MPVSRGHVLAHVIRSLETLFNGPDLSYSQIEVIEGETYAAFVLSYQSEVRQSSLLLGTF